MNQAAFGSRAGLSRVCHLTRKTEEWFRIKRPVLTHESLGLNPPKVPSIGLPPHLHFSHRSCYYNLNQHGRQAFFPRGNKSPPLPLFAEQGFPHLQ